MLSGDLFKSGGEIAELRAVGVLQPRAAGEELFEMKGFGGTGTLPCWGPEPRDALGCCLCNAGEGWSSMGRAEGGLGTPSQGKVWASGVELDVGAG